MDDSTSPTHNLQIEPKDGCHPGDCVESTVTRLPSASDENENQLDGDGCEHLTSSDSAMGKPEVLEQDSLNNNESCAAGCEAAPSENSEGASWEGPRDRQALLGRDKKTPARRSSRSKRSTARKEAAFLSSISREFTSVIEEIACNIRQPDSLEPEVQVYRNAFIPPKDGFKKMRGINFFSIKTDTVSGLSSGDITHLLREDVPSAATLAVSEEPAEVNANDQAEAPRLALQSLFSLIRGEVEQLDSRALPLCLHQIAESYFQEEDYEKAMKFIQLERLYHEQLLANLSAIQEQWETKWKTVQPHTVTSLKNSEKGFNGEDFERLTKFCTTHQDPLLSKHKIVAVEKTLERKNITQLLTASSEPKERGATAKEPESSACLGMDPGSDGQHKETLESAPGDQQAGPQSPGKAREEEPGSARATLALPAQPAAAAARTRSGPHCAGNACEAAGSPLAPTDGCQGLIATGDAAADPESALSSESMREPLILPGSEHLPPARIPEGRCAQTTRKELHLALEDASQALPTSQPENNELNEPRQPELTDSDGKSPPGPADSPETGLCENGKTADLSAALPELPMAPEGKGDQIDLVNKETEDYLNSLLEGCLKDAAESFSYDDNQEEDSDLLQDLSPEEASYSLQENLPPDDSCLSLDDLAKRIEIAEVVPAEGLVSILKKRNDTLGDHPAQMQQKPSKRRVRFQEIDDHLDQDEVGGGSCILLILLCIVTVFLSVGGTALYCSFGDMESPVCTDFADNVDFYYAKLLQGMAELKHWVYLS